MGAFTHVPYFGPPRSAVRNTPEFRRVAALPRRRIEEIDLEALIDYWTEALKCRGGTQRLRGVQALAFEEMATYGGAFCPIQVGGGKTLITLLAPTVLEAQRPVLITLANLIEKTRRELDELQHHWRIESMRMISYELLGREAYANKLEEYECDALILDEAHRVKNKKAAVSRRFRRYVTNHPEVPVVALSGTMMRSKIEEFGPLLQACLRDQAPIPKDEGEAIEWGEALDLCKDGNPRDPGVLLRLGNETGADDMEIARKNFQRRLLETPGVIATNTEDVSASLYINPIEYQIPAHVEAMYGPLRTDWETPDGWTFDEAVQLWNHAQQMALGLHYVWDPRPPVEWLQARKNWTSFVRGVLSESRTIDSPKQVRSLVEAGKIKDSGALAKWLALAPTFAINSKAVWHDEGAIELCAKWADKNDGIIWTAHKFFARVMAKKLGLTYYGREGLSESGQYIEAAPKGRAIVASIKANMTGRNLQHTFNKNLVLAPPSSSADWEQLIGRTHRFGQKADEVTVDYLIACSEHINAMRVSLASAHHASDTMGQPQKLLIGDLTMPHTQPREGRQWIATQIRED